MAKGRRRPSRKRGQERLTLFRKRFLMVGKAYYRHFEWLTERASKEGKCRAIIREWGERQDG